MHISDEKLSAFLDNELPQNEMEHIRNALVQNEDLADRVAVLSQVDDSVQRFAKGIDATQAPDSILALLRDDDTQQESATSADIISLSVWQRARQGVREHVALAAGVALLIGVGAGQWIPFGSEEPGATQWTHVSAALNQTPSGQQIALASGEVLQPYFSFIAGDGRLCRSYSVQGTLHRDEIACRQEGQWSPIATAYKENVATGEYAAASANQLMDATLMALQGSEALSLSEEQRRLSAGD
ncbi:hypothetical protein [Aliidiomarina indica]|uniref:hypothetical protein n=1 Tax=Aliidiomarina indica TaxID=2749147 RepID=UPI0018903720|nr:hypothetical protein [Aliidiomarina indica]